MYFNKKIASSNYLQSIYLTVSNRFNPRDFTFVDGSVAQSERAEEDLIWLPWALLEPDSYFKRDGVPFLFLNKELPISLDLQLTAVTLQP